MSCVAHASIQRANRGPLRLRPAAVLSVNGSLYDSTELLLRRRGSRRLRRLALLHGRALEQELEVGDLRLLLHLEDLVDGLEELAAHLARLNLALERGLDLVQRDAAAS